MKSESGWPRAETVATKLERSQNRGWVLNKLKQNHYTKYWNHRPLITASVVPLMLLFHSLINFDDNFELRTMQLLIQSCIIKVLN